MSGFTAAQVPDLHGRTVFVTGANTGLGFEASTVLAARGARVLLGCRSPDKGSAARARIVAEHAHAEIEVVQVDLGSLASVREAAARVADEPRLDVLINNAGIMMPPLEYTVDGFESQFGVNHLGPFALTGLLLDKLAEHPGARVVNTASNAHKTGDIDFDDLRAEKSYRPSPRYSQSKLANLLHMLELHRRLQAAGSTTLAMACHPGGAATDLFRQWPALSKPVVPVIGLVLNTAAQGAWPTLQAATDPAAKSGEYFGPDGFMELRGESVRVRPTRKARDPERARRLWEVSVELTGVDPGI